MKKNTREMIKIRLNKFMKNVGKQDMNVHRQSHDNIFGTVKLVHAAYEGGKRRYSVKNSIIPSGAYTYKSLKTRLSEAIVNG